MRCSIAFCPPQSNDGRRRLLLDRQHPAMNSTPYRWSWVEAIDWRRAKKSRPRCVYLVSAAQQPSIRLSGIMLSITETPSGALPAGLSTLDGKRHQLVPGSRPLPKSWRCHPPTSVIQPHPCPHRRRTEQPSSGRARVPAGKPGPTMAGWVLQYRATPSGRRRKTYSVENIDLLHELLAIPACGF